MKDRIIQIMRSKQMTQQEFARALEISPASLSNIFNGKTNPTGNHVTAIHRRFPDISVNWLMFGEGDMLTTVSDATNDSATSLPSSAAAHAAIEAVAQDKVVDDVGHEPKSVSDKFHPSTVDMGCPSSDKEPAVVREIIKFIDKPQRKITEIRIFFDDGTFEVFSK